MFSQGRHHGEIVLWDVTVCSVPLSCGFAAPLLNFWEALQILLEAQQRNMMHPMSDSLVRLSKLLRWRREAGMPSHIQRVNSRLLRQKNYMAATS